MDGKYSASEEIYCLPPNVTPHLSEVWKQPAWKVCSVLIEMGSHVHQWNVSNFERRLPWFVLCKSGQERWWPTVFPGLWSLLEQGTLVLKAGQTWTVGHTRFAVASWVFILGLGQSAGFMALQLKLWFQKSHSDHLPLVHTSIGILCPVSLDIN